MIPSYCHGCGLIVTEYCRNCSADMIKTPLSEIIAAEIYRANHPGQALMVEKDARIAELEAEITDYKGLVMLDGPPTEQGWYWCCEAYSPYAMYVVWVFVHGGHNDHEMTFEEAAEIEAQWWGPIQAPKDPEYYGTSQAREHNTTSDR